MTIRVVKISTDEIETVIGIIDDEHCYSCGCGGDDGPNPECYCQTGQTFENDYTQKELDKLEVLNLGNYNEWKTN